MHTAASTSTTAKGPLLLHNSERTLFLYICRVFLLVKKMCQEHLHTLFIQYFSQVTVQMQLTCWIDVVAPTDLCIIHHKWSLNMSGFNLKSFFFFKTQQNNVPCFRSTMNCLLPPLILPPLFFIFGSLLTGGILFISSPTSFLTSGSIRSIETKS